MINMSDIYWAINSAVSSPVYSAIRSAVYWAINSDVSSPVYLDVRSAVGSAIKRGDL